MAAPTDIRCTCKVCTRIRVTIDQIFCVLDVYGWLLNSYIVVCNIRNLSCTSIFYSVVFVRVNSIWLQTCVFKCVSLSSSSRRALMTLLLFFKYRIFSKTNYGTNYREVGGLHCKILRLENSVNGYRETSRGEYRYHTVRT